MKIEKIKPTPEYIVALIKKKDKESYKAQDGYTRFYSYLTTNDRELVKVTVAVRNYRTKWYCKQCAVHGVHSKECFVKDIGYSIYGGYYAGWYAEGLSRTPKWCDYEQWEDAPDKWGDPYAPIVNKEYISKFPEYKYSAAEIYEGVDILKYLRLYEKYPQAEYLVKLGLSEYAKSEQILRKAGKDKKFQKWLSSNRKELRGGYYYITTILRAYQENKPLKETQDYERKKRELCRESSYAPIRKMLNGAYEKYIEYIGKQKITNRLYLDYLNACNYLGLDMSEEKNRFPHDFKHWHDVRIDEYATAKAIKDEKEREELYGKFALVAEKYLPLQDEKKGEYVAIIAKSPAELILEGDKLGHCVGKYGYDQKFAREETLIFFIRSRDCPDVPFVTVEYSLEDKKVYQCYGKGNTTPDNAVMHYVNDIWLPYANKKLKRIAV